MIRSFAHKGFEKFVTTGSKAGIQPDHVKKLLRIAAQLNVITSPEGMNLPGYFLHMLQPPGEKRWSVRVSGNWRVTFRFIDGEAYDVDYLDYH